MKECTRRTYFREEYGNHAFQSFITIDLELFELLLQFVVGLRGDFVEDGLHVAQHFVVGVHLVLISRLVRVLHAIAEVGLVGQVDGRAAAASGIVDAVRLIV